ncbi:MULTISPECIES: NF038130 family PEP-CTERM protein [Moorena]|nr:MULTISPECIES: NF038130 family PEP-CTERM protein [Moorena]NEQ12761.1 PEP-CTERM sorting domain-containing protein [Moorena sp. SIO3E2]NEP36923.1 PEP-CTERM sorting domain-containing protein [Moorena sp. SIO3B2]NEP67776.1 PEP-CTERM sorting domain-containing protein [Moorena sp. SIO3A5]NER90196.1 PEP-CTERM sorting domain-containing protein [Moorena sp. SIO3A2]OLT64418.1 PEP-CTERM domain protein [Moorena producens 3L]
MKSTVMKMWLGASIIAGISAIATTPAVAGSLTGATLIGSDYLKIASDGTNTYIDPGASLSTLLQGDASDPGGNVELFASSETLENFQFFFSNDVTSLTGQIGGKDITLSSLTFADWATDFGGITLAQKWFSDALTANGLVSLIGSGLDNVLYGQFFGNGGLQRFSDPNISYLNQDDTTGLITIGLAGHFNARDMLAEIIPPAFAGFLPPSIQASEIVKVEYDGKTQYLYGFEATDSGLVSLDDNNDYTYSHTGNYQLAFGGSLPPHLSNPQDVPESSTLLGLIVVGGLFTAGGLVDSRQKYHKACQKLK